MIYLILRNKDYMKEYKLKLQIQKKNSVFFIDKLKAIKY